MTSISTRVLSVSQVSPQAEIIQEAADILRQGGIVAFPTETVYGLGADAMNPGAVNRVFSVKQRPADNPLIVHIATIGQVSDLASNIPPHARSLMDAFWPGPLTLVLDRNPSVPDIITAGLETVAVRMPGHKVALAIIRTLGHAIVGPSANLSGKPSPTTAQHVIDDLNGAIEMILDAGPTEIGVESTVVDVTADPPLLLRFGAVTREQLETVVGPVLTAEDEASLRRSPGTRHRHYAPKARVMLVNEGDVATFNRLLQEYLASGASVGCIIHSDALKTQRFHPSVCSVLYQMEEYSHRLFATFRELDKRGVGIVLVEKVSEHGIGAAVMDRLRRAAAGSNPTDL